MFYNLCILNLSITNKFLIFCSALIKFLIIIVLLRERKSKASKNVRIKKLKLPIFRIIIKTNVNKDDRKQLHRVKLILGEIET